MYNSARFIAAHFHAPTIKPCPLSLPLGGHNFLSEVSAEVLITRQNLNASRRRHTRRHRHRPRADRFKLFLCRRKQIKEYNLYLEGGNKHKKQESSRFDISSNRETCGTYSPHRQASLAGLGTTEWEGHKRGEEGPAILRIKCEKNFAFRYAPHHSQHRRARGQPEPIIVVADFFHC